MTTFDRREEAFENMFVHDEELQFKAAARRAKLLAAWVAGVNGKTGPDAEAYIGETVAFAVAHAGEQALFDRVRSDLQGANVGDAQIRERMTALLAEAVAYVKTA